MQIRREKKKEKNIFIGRLKSRTDVTLGADTYVCGSRLSLFPDSSCSRAGSCGQEVGSQIPQQHEPWQL